MQTMTVRNPREELRFEGSLAADAGAAGELCAAADAAFSPKTAEDAKALEKARGLQSAARRAREQFFRAHVTKIYDDLTDGCSTPLRVSELLYAAADRYPNLLPTRERIG